MENCSRERLENMQVRYLGKEERRLYEVVVDREGKLCWRKDGLRVDTSGRWKDSVRGIVKVDDPTPPWAHRPAPYRGSSESSGLSSKEEEPDISSPTSPSSPNLKTTTTKESREAHIQAAASSPTSPTVPRHTSFHTLFHSKSDKKEKTPPKPKQKWIFVADTNNNRRLPALLLPPGLPHLRRRTHHRQGRAVAHPAAALGPLSDAES